MSLSVPHRTSVLLLALAFTTAPLFAQKKGKKAAAAPAAAASDQLPALDSLNTLRFRNLGPSVGGGRVAAVVGVPGQPQIYYVGAAGGGVWKTTDGGESFDAVFKDEPSPSIGAIALAPSNPNLVWVGTGEANIRNDVLNGKGVFFSPDAGKTWEAKGLADVGQISKIVIDPNDPNVVFVAAIGHAWTPNPDRGVFRTADGGKTWQKVLFVNDTVGCSDLEIDPGNPRVLFAGMWQVVRHPWMLVSGGAGSGIYRSTDGGLTWKKLTEGLPGAPVGRIALAASPMDPSHIYALIEAPQGRLWDTHDLGDHWTKVSDYHGLTVRPWYFSHLYVAPNDDKKVYFLSFQLLESDDGGKTTHQIDRGVHVDHHAFWIDPTNPNRFIQGNDGGSYVTYNGGASWQWFNNLPIEQFYMVAADNNVPYNLCGGLQDNNAWCGPSTSLFGGLNGSEWFTVAGGDGEYAVPAPSDSTILYVDSQNGSVTRLDTKTGMTRFIKPYLLGVEQEPPANLQYRFNWTTPIAVSNTNPDEVFVGGNVVFKSIDGGRTWNAISPDLTRNDKSKQQTSGGPIDYDISGAESYNTLLTVNIAPTDSNVIWTGADDGTVEVTKDGGKTWASVGGRIPGLPHPEGATSGRVYQIGISPFDPGTAYLAVDFHEFNDDRPYVYKTTDYGQTWTGIGAGLPQTDAAVVVREDPNLKNFLVLGTNCCLYYSRDGGASWRRLTAGLPTAAVWDVKFIQRNHDLVLATHGRGLFVLDNITPLEEATPAVTAEAFHVFSTQPAMIRAGRRRGGVAPTNFSTPPAPNGAVVDYWLAQEIKPAGRGPGGEAGPAAGAGGFGGRRGAVAALVTDAQGDTVFTDSTAPSKQGFNRFVWNLRYNGPVPLTIERPQPGQEENPFRQSGGPRVVPGTYTVTLTANGQSQSQKVTVQPDPVIPSDPAGFAALLAAGLESRNEVSALNTMLNRLVSLENQLTGMQTALRASGGDSTLRPVMGAARQLSRKLKELKDSLYNSDVQRDAPQDDIHYLARFQDRMGGGFGGFGAYAEPPTPEAQRLAAENKAMLEQYLAKFNAILSTDVVAFNKMAGEHSAPVLVAGAPVEIKPAHVATH